MCDILAYTPNFIDKYTYIGELLGLSVCNASKVQNQTRVYVHSGTHDIDIDFKYEVRKKNELNWTINEKSNHVLSFCYESKHKIRRSMKN